MSCSGVSRVFWVIIRSLSRMCYVIARDGRAKRDGGGTRASLRFCVRALRMCMLVEHIRHDDM